MKSIYIILSAVLVFALIYLMVDAGGSGFDRRQKSRQCEATEKAINEQVSGVLLSAYREEDFHLVETIVYSDNGNEVKSTIFLLEQSGLHNVLMPQDSIYKESGSLDFVVNTKWGKESIRIDLWL
jgi:hypothetical protein